MVAENLSSSQLFLIVGFSDHLNQGPLFVAFLLIYLSTLLGNLIIMGTIYTNPHLHTPMYFFLTNLSFVDIIYTSVIFPQMLVHFFVEGTYISIRECLLQMYFFIVMLSVEILLLTVMAFDRYVAICNSLRYTTIMNSAMCVRLAFTSWVFGLLDPIPHTILVSRLSFCNSHIINHFFCDIAALMKLSCSSTHNIDSLTYIFGSCLTVMSFILVVISYINIILSILKMQSTGRRWKAFSTCASHLTVVILFYGSVCSTYIRPTSTIKDSKILSLSYIAVAPMFNPIIYSLKNIEIKEALKQMTSKAQKRRRDKKILFTS